MEYEIVYALKCITIYQILHAPGYHMFIHVSKLPHFMHALESSLPCRSSVYMHSDVCQIFHSTGRVQLTVL